MKHGKTNQFGRVEISACMRNTNVEICSFMALGSYLFWRWHVHGEQFPSFESSRDWFDYKLLTADSGPTTPISYNAHLGAVNKAFRACNIISKAKTHAARGASARMADLNGVAESDIRRQGQWNNSAMNGAYLTTLPRGIMRSMAGFPTAEGHFYLPRAQVIPPESLIKKVFPYVDYWYDRMANNRCQRTCAAKGFLELLKVLRVTFLQDSVLMMDKHPDNPVWHHRIFHDEEYLSFKRYEYHIVCTLNNSFAN
jgi:hypothetical protein